jgi:methionine sulfoxide reductase heme-binding subunit
MPVSSTGMKMVEVDEIEPAGDGSGHPLPSLEGQSRECIMSIQAYPSPQPSLVSRIWNAKPTFWLLLSLPAIPMLAGLASGEFKQLLHPTGEFAARFMIISMMLTPLMMLFPKSGAMRWLMKRRRHIGVAAFAYAALHTLAYVLHEGTLAKILGELSEAKILTGLAAMLIFLLLALTSNDFSLRAIGVNWKTMQRLVYVAAVAVLAHWLLSSKDIGGALIHFSPLAVLQIYRIGRNLKWWSFRFA